MSDLHNCRPIDCPGIHVSWRPQHVGPFTCRCGRRWVPSAGGWKPEA